MHVLGAGIRSVDARRIRAGMPVIDRGIVLHAGIAAEVGTLGDHAQQVARFVSFKNLSRPHITGLPLTIFLHGLHELIGDTD